MIPRTTFWNISVDQMVKFKKSAISIVSFKAVEDF